MSARTDGRHGLFFLVVAGTAGLGGLLFGYDTGVISGALLFLQKDFSLTSTMSGVVTSVALLGAVVGAASGGPLADRLGRRAVMLGTAAIFIAGALIAALAASLATLLAGRLLVGIGIGVASFVAPLYIAEIAPADRRGALVSLNQLAITVGILLSYLAGYGLSAAGLWRWMFGLGAVPGAVLLLAMLALPETPRWLAGHGRTEEARAVLRRAVATELDVEAELALLRRDLTREGHELGWRGLAEGAVRLPLIIGVGLAILQQVTGINTVIYYAPMIFQAAGFVSASASILATAGVGVVNLLMTLVAIRLIDRRGRRGLLLWGLAGMAASLVVLAAGFAFGAASGALGMLTTVALTAYVGFFAIGLGPVFWLLISEIFPLHIRGRAMGVATVANWGFNVIVALTFLDLVDAAGRPVTFLIYAGLSVAGWIFTWALVPETRGRTLETIERQWAERDAAQPRV